MQNFDPHYPEKPTIIRRKRNRHISITFFSIVLFALTFSWILNDFYVIGLLLGILLFHELGHFMMMKLFRYKELNMLFIPFMGAMVSGKKDRYSQKESALVVIAGPLPGIILGASLLLFNWIGNEMLSIQLGVMLIALNVMNLVPIDPLDGGRLIKNLFFDKFEFTQLIFIALSSLVIIIFGIYFNVWVLTLFGFLLGFRIKNKHQLYLIRKEMKESEIEYESSYDDISNKTYHRIKKILSEHIPALKEIEINDLEEQYEQLIAKQVDGVLAPPTKRDASIYFKIFMLLLWLGGFVLSAFALLSTDFNLIGDAFRYR